MPLFQCCQHCKLNSKHLRYWVSETDISKPGQIKTNLHGQIGLEKREEHLVFVILVNQPFDEPKSEQPFVRKGKPKELYILPGLACDRFKACSILATLVNTTQSMVYYKMQAVPIKISQIWYCESPTSTLSTQTGLGLSATVNYSLLV